MGKTKGRAAEGPSVAGEVSGLETIALVTDSAVDLTVTGGGSAVVTTVILSGATVAKADSVTVGRGVGLALLVVARTEVGRAGRATVVCGSREGGAGEVVGDTADGEAVEGGEERVAGWGGGGVSRIVVTSLGGAAGVTAVGEVLLRVAMSV